MIGIYKITNPTGKVYIGQSTNIERRRVEYSNKNKSKGQVVLYRSLMKYGFSSHIFEVVEECTAENLNVRERYWQEYYNVLQEGLNCRLTGTEDRSGVFSKESLRKRVASTDYQSFQTKRLASRDEQAISRKKYKAVLQYTKEGTFVREWESLKQAADSLKLYYVNISNCLQGRQRTAGGFTWEYKKN
jgi:hypothetical protein